MKNLEAQQLLKILVQIPAPSGYESRFGLIDKLKELIPQESITVGNNLVYKFGHTGKKILISAHIDEVGFFVVKNDSFAYALPIGAVDIKSIHKSVPIEVYDFVSRIKVDGLLYPDSTIKLASDIALSQASLAVFKKTIQYDGDMIISPSLDNKVGVTALLDIASTLRSQNIFQKYQLYCVFAPSEEQNMNGVMRVVRKINPDFCIDIDSAYAQPYDFEDSKSWIIPEIGRGPALQLMGKGWILTDTIRLSVTKSARDKKNNFQYELPSGNEGGTNAISYVNAGIPFCQINIPVANQHTCKSKASINDIIAVKPLVFSVLDSVNEII